MSDTAQPGSEVNDTVELTDEQQREADAVADAAAAADLSAGFNAERGVEPAAVVDADTPAGETPSKDDDKPTGDTPTGDQPAGDKTAAATAATDKVDEPDPWEGVHPVVREHIEKLSSRTRNVEGHIGGLKSALDAAKVASAAGKEAPSSAQIQEAATAGPKWKQLQDDFPEWAEAAEERFGKPVAGGISAEDAKAIALESADKGRRLAQVDIKHPDWEETINTKDFQTWLAAQPEETRVLAESDKPKDAIKLLDGFGEQKKAAADKAAEESRVAAEKAAAADKQKKRLAPAAPVKGNSPGGPTRLNDEAAFTAGFKEVRG